MTSIGVSKKPPKTTSKAGRKTKVHPKARKLLWQRHAEAKWQNTEQVLTKKNPELDTTEAFDVGSLRLRYVLHQLEHGELSISDLKLNLEYAALVLETAYLDETRKVIEPDDDEDLRSVVSQDAVPNEVREWLASTFTRQVRSRPANERLKFKSVANAIRTGIMFDKMFRRLSGAVQAPIPPEIGEALKDINEWNFDVNGLNEVAKGQALKYVGLELFNRYGFLTRYKIPFAVLESFLLCLEEGYSKHKNPYHNLIHGADIAQTTHWMLTQTGMIECLTELEVFAAVYAALIHDYEHTGHTNNFHIQSGSEFALLYNDRSVLENHHISSTFRLLRNSENNILNALSREQYREFRNLVIEIVLATDMSTHFVQVKSMKNMLSMPESIDKIKALSLMVHCCDISHPAKSWDIHITWSQRVLEEFFRQGDMEAEMGLPYSPLCDRTTTNVANSQIGFIDFIVEPSMQVLGEMLVKMVEPMVQMPPEHDENEKGATLELENHNLLKSPTGSQRSNSASSMASGASIMKRIPIATDGRLEIPMPWISCMAANKGRWKEKAEEEQRKKMEAEKAAMSKD